MSDRFTDQLASRLGISEDAARQMLAVFNGYLFEELERSGAAVIPDVGSFSRENGSIVFEADTALAAIVNARNAGLEELTASRRGVPEEDPGSVDEDPVAIDEPQEVLVEDVQTSDTGVEAPVLDEDPESNRLTDAQDLDDPLLEANDLEETAVEESPGTIADDEPIPADVPVTDSSFSARDDIPQATILDRPPDAEDDDAAEELVAESIAPVPSTEFGSYDVPPRADVPEQQGIVTAAHDEEESADHEVVAGPVRDSDQSDVVREDLTQEESGMNEHPHDRPPATPDRKRSGAPWLLIGVIVILVGIVGLAALFITGDRDEPRQPAVSETPPPPEDEFLADDPAADDAFDDDEFGEDFPADEPEPAPTTPSEPGDPLFGDAIDRTQSRYTLVIASLPSQGAAETIMNSWRNRGFRAAVFSETIDGVTRYRVGVGQFDTISSADAARSEGNVAADLPEGTWVYRYPASTSN